MKHNLCYFSSAVVRLSHSSLSVIFFHLIYGVSLFKVSGPMSVIFAIGFFAKLVIYIIPGGLKAVSSDIYLSGQNG